VPGTQRYPYWDNHPAKEALEDDISNRIAGTMLPSKLRMTRRGYQDFSSKIFCVRVHAESRKQREQTFWVAKCNKTALACHLKEAAEDGLFSWMSLPTSPPPKNVERLI
jgi:hypothetical protein